LAGRNKIETGLFNWADFVMDLVEVVALGVIILLLLRADRHITALLRIMRRMDRKTPDPSTISYRAQAERNEAGMGLKEEPRLEAE
jgi:hypothetical protein